MKICFWGNNSNALNGSPSGGGELQIALLAKALAKSGHEVIFVDYNLTQDFCTEDGIKVYCIKGYNDGIRVFRTLTIRLKLIYQTLKNQNADVYYCRIRDFRHILVFWAARRIKSKFVLALASDIDASGIATRLKYLLSADIKGIWWYFNAFVSEFVYFWLLRKSDMILVQHEGQKNMLLGKGIKSEVFSNLIDLRDIPVKTNTFQDGFCYVGSLDKRKGFADFFAIVEKCQFLHFKVIGKPRDKMGESHYKKLKMHKNVTLYGRLNHRDTLNQISTSQALISTSPMEGFPNIFLEAWACGIPVLSLHFDPGGIIQKENLGFVANGDKESLIRAMISIDNTSEFEKQAKEYIENNHVMNERKTREINDLFVSMMKNKS
jgi:glycosyltransferase involved in cell wall biosynthesis